MSDQGFREVQLSGKQVVFLFMALAVVLVGTFLLGVSVGRHVEPEAVSAQTTPTATATASDLNASGPMPPPTTITPDDTKYRETLRGQAPPATSPASNPPPASLASTPNPPAPAPKTTPTPEAKAATPPAAGDTWFVQVDSFSESSNASRRVSELKGKGVTAKVVKSGSHYQVRVGPFDRQGADAMDARLRKLGYKPRVTR